MKEIKAKEGMYLTQVEDTDSRIFVKALSGANIKEADWRDATIEEKEEFEKLNSELYGE